MTDSPKSRIGFESSIELVVRGPILVTSGEIGPWGVDAIALRDPKGRLVITGDAIQGKLRESFDQISNSKNSKDPFERSRKEDIAVAVDRDDATKFQDSQSKNLDAPSHRYPISFSDFVSKSVWPKPGVQTLTQIAIDLETGATSRGQLRVFDCPAKAGELVRFVGDIRFFADSINDATNRMNQVLEAFRWILSIGSQKSVGFGRVIEVNQLGE